MERDPDIAERYKRGKAKAIAHVAKGLLQKARSGDTVSSIFFLKTQAGWRETDRLEHAGGLTINVVDRSDDPAMTGRHDRTSARSSTSSATARPTAAAARSGTAAPARTAAR